MLPFTNVPQREIFYKRQRFKILKISMNIRINIFPEKGWNFFFLKLFKVSILYRSEKAITLLVLKYVYSVRPTTSDWQHFSKSIKAYSANMCPLELFVKIEIWKYIKHSRCSIIDFINIKLWTKQCRIHLLCCCYVSVLRYWRIPFVTSLLDLEM